MDAKQGTPETFRSKLATYWLTAGALGVLTVGVGLVAFRLSKEDAKAPIEHQALKPVAEPAAVPAPAPKKDENPFIIRPAALAPAPAFRVDEVNVVCHGQPDHAAYQIVVRNDTDKTKRVKRGYFSPSFIGPVNWTPPFIAERGCNSLTTGKLPLVADVGCNLVGIPVRVDNESKQGVPVEFDLNLAIPPKESRSFVVSVLFTQPKDAIRQFGLRGSVVLSADDDECTSREIVIIGPLPAKATPLPPFNSPVG